MSVEFVLRAIVVFVRRENIDDETLLIFADLIESLKKVKSDVYITCLTARNKLGMQGRVYQEVEQIHSIYSYVVFTCCGGLEPNPLLLITLNVLFTSPQ